MCNIMHLEENTSSDAYIVLGSKLAVTSQEVTLGVVSVSSLLSRGRKGKQAVRNY